MRVWEREIHFLRRTQAISAQGGQCEELLLQGVTLQKVQLLAQEARLVGRKAGIFQKASIKGRQEPPWHKHCLPALNTAKGFIDMRGEAERSKREVG